MLKFYLPTLAASFPLSVSLSYLRYVIFSELIEEKVGDTILPVSKYPNIHFLKTRIHCISSLFIEMRNLKMIK